MTPTPPSDIGVPRDSVLALLREAYTRLMVSEGDARYIDSNVALAERIAQAVVVDVPSTMDTEAALVAALQLHKERISRLQRMLCECDHIDTFQASLHDESCPVYLAGEPS